MTLGCLYAHKHKRDNMNKDKKTIGRVISQYLYNFV